jgi:hypothetical protein
MTGLGRPTLPGSTAQLRSELAATLERAAFDRGVADEVGLLHWLAGIDAQLAFDGVDAFATAEATEERHHLRDAVSASTPLDQRCHLGRAQLARWRRVGGSVDASADPLWFDERCEETIVEFVDELGPGLDQFAAMQVDVAGPNALVRSGLVTRWYLPNGKPMIAKRSNPFKAGRLDNECRVVRSVAERLGADDELFTVVTPLLALRERGTSSIRTSIMIDLGLPTVEDYLLAEWRRRPRQRVLHDCRTILDSLFAAGILWHDMSPRNILIEQHRGGNRYHLVDFEKAELDTYHAVSTPVRRHFCRGQIAIEEFGVLCSTAELVDFLGDYFDPESWSTASIEPVAYRLRPDLVDVLRGRSIEDPSEGECNRLDQQIIQVRRPMRVGVEWIHPGHVGFRVEHYLSWAGDSAASDYDRLTTEAFLEALSAGTFDLAARVLIEASRTLEAAVVVDALLGRAGVPSDRSSRAVEAMKHTIEAFATSPLSPGNERCD